MLSTSRLLTLALCLTLPALAAEPSPTLSEAAQAKYREANAKITAGAYGEAVATLNALAGEYPRVAELFAARCSAQIGLKRYPGAEADCTYALAVKPELPVAVHALGMAQEAQGKRDAAIASFRRYAAYDEKAAPFREQALARMAALASGTQAPAPAAAMGKLIVYRNHRFAGPGRITLVLDNKLVGDIEHEEYVEIEAAAGEHVLEARGNSEVWTRPIKLGGAAVYANLDTHGGKVVLQEVPAAQGRQEVQDDGCDKAYARQITPQSADAPPMAAAQVLVAPLVVAGPAPSCRMGSDGRQACGYNCRIGSDGVAACADTPNGTCAIDSSGQVTCSQLGGGPRGGMLIGAGPKPECRMGSNGRNTCGYNCRLGSGGSFFCASRPDGQCAMNSDGTWTCP